jgi:hypothetical protein
MLGKKSKEEAKRDLIEEAKLFRQVFSNGPGAKVLGILRGEFSCQPDVIHTPGDSHATEYKLGCAAPISFIETMLKVGADNELES